ncbi:MAG TPA: hypothetical protein VFS21_08405 [Roseiflexaceae bacterium]|nr:hypothetical protein [Roseiflexaceae bacterium]
MPRSERAGAAALRRAAGIVPGWLRRTLFALAGLFLFILALQMLKQGAGQYGREIVRLLNINSPINSLGFGWLLAYVFLSGSPVAAVAISFFASGTITDLQTFTMITGSRLGASFIVLFVGFLYYLRGHQRSASIAIGILALLTTAAIYLPALVLGWWLLTSGLLRPLQVNADSPLASVIDLVFDPILDAITGLGLPGWAVFVGGAAALLLAFSLLDRALPEMSAERSSFQRIGRLIYRPMAMFLLGAAVTSVTLSVSVSLSILVPLSARGLVRRENTLPYIMGANITTFIDTLVAALITGGPAAFTIVLVEMVSVAFLSLLVLLLFYRRFESAMLRAQEAILHSNGRLAAFLGVMLLVPLILLLVR